MYDIYKRGQELKPGNMILFRYDDREYLYYGRVVETDEYRTLIDESEPYTSIQEWYSTKLIHVLTDDELEELEMEEIDRFPM